MHNWSACSLGNAGDSRRVVSGVGTLRGIFVVLLLFVAVAVEAQTLTKESYASEVTKVSKQICPLKMQGCVVDSFFYQPNYLHEVITMKDDYMFDRSNEELKQYFADVFRYRFEIHACKGLYEKLLKMDGGFVIYITLDSSRRSFSLTYTPEEFKQIWADRKKTEYQDSLTWIARHDVFMSLWFQNKYDCSKTVTEDYPLSIDSVWLSGDTVVFHTTVLDTAYSYVEEDLDNLILFWKETLLFTEGNYLADDMADAGYHFLAAYENIARTDSFHIFFSNTKLQDFILEASKITEATDEQMETFLKKDFLKATLEDWEGSVETQPDIYRSAKVDYRDGFIEILLLLNKDNLNFNMNPSEFTSFKNFYCVTIRQNLENMLELPYIMDDTVLVSLENLYQHLKGYKILYIEDSTHKALNLEISTDEIRNAKLIAIPADEITSDKIEEQLKLDKYARDVVEYNRVLCPLVSGCNVVDSMAYDYQNLNYYCHLNPSCQLSSDTAIIKQEIKKQLRFSASETTLFTDLTEVEGGLILHFHLSQKDSTVTIFITPQEMWSIVHGDTLSERERARFALNAYIANINERLPMLLDFMTRVDSLSIEDGNLVFHHSVLSQFDMIKKDQSLVEWSVRDRLLSGDSQVSYQMLMCYRSGYGMCYRYVRAVPASGKKKIRKPKKSDVINVCFSAEELEEMVR